MVQKPHNRPKIRGVARVVTFIGLGIMLIHLAHALTLDRIVEYKEITFAAPNIPAELNGYRIAFITDTHAISARRLRAVVAELNNRQIDLLLLGGDFQSYGKAPWRSMEILAQIATTDGIFGVEGNHDNYQDLFAAMLAHGITPLANSGVLIRDNFFLAGLEDLWNRHPCIATAIAAANPDDFIILLSHNPDIAMQQNTTDIDLILSGHTHGGQITLFGIWAPYLSLRRTITAYGQRFRAGWAEASDGTPVYVSRGTGEYLPRVFSRPEVTLITLVAE